MELFRRWVKTLPTLGAAFILAMVVWVLAVTSTDPAEERAYQQPVTIEIKSQDPSLLITNEIPEQTSVVLRAPLSVWEKIYADASAVRAFMDLSGIEAGSHTVPVKIQVAYQPSSVVSNEVASVDLVLEELVSKDFNVELVTFGSPASGYELGLSTLSQESVVVSGPESKVNAVQSVRATFILGNSNESIERDTSLVAIDEDGNVITGVSIAPANITIYQEITQRGGYRSVVIKVAFSGHVSTGYRLTNITVNPPIITVYSEDPALVENLQGYIETVPLNLDGVDSDLDLNLALNMPQGISLDGEPTVMVHVGVSPLEGSLTLASQKVEIIGLEQGLTGRVSPAFVDVIISGPLPMLNKLTSSDVHVIMDLSGEGIGTYQKQPSVTISIPSLTADSILPDTLDVVISVAGTPTPKP